MLLAAEFSPTDLEFDVPDQQPVLLSSSPPNREQKLLASVVAVILLAAFAAAVPFARVQRPPIYALVAVYAAVMLLNNLATGDAIVRAVFDFPVPRPAVPRSGLPVCQLAHGAVRAHLSGHFSQSGMLGAGPKTSGTIFLFWHCGFPIAAIAYAMLKDSAAPAPMPAGSAQGAVVRSIVAVVVIVTALTWLADNHSAFLPEPLQDIVNSGALYHWLWAPLVLTLNALALWMLWTRQRSLLDLWLIVVSWSLLLAAILMISPSPVSIWAGTWRAASRWRRRCSCSWSCLRNRHSSTPTSWSRSAPSAAPARNNWRRSMPSSARFPDELRQPLASITRERQRRVALAVAHAARPRRGALSLETAGSNT